MTRQPWRQKVAERLKFWRWYDKYIEAEDDSAGCCKSDRSWGCLALGVLAFGFFSGLGIGWAILYTPLRPIFLTEKSFPPEPVHVTEGLWPGVKYEFFTQEPHSYDEASKICRDRNSTLLTFDSYLESNEEKNFDCYLRVRANAEQRKFLLWMHPTILMGDGKRYFDWEDYKGSNPSSQAVVDWSLANGCDLLRDLTGRLDEISKDLNRTQMATYHLVKRYDNYGIRTAKHGSRLGCWDQMREVRNRKLPFVCRAKLNNGWNETGAIIKETRYDFDFKDDFNKEFCDTRNRADNYNFLDAIKCAALDCPSMYHDIPGMENSYY